MAESSLAHASRDCACHIVWIPKYGRKAVRGGLGREMVETVRGLVGRGAGGMVEGGACPDRIHLCLRMPPKYAVREVVGRLKGRSPVVPRERHPEHGRATGRDKTLWARGYYVSTVGLDEAVIRDYIKRREEGGRFE